MVVENIKNLKIEDFKNNRELAEYIEYIDNDFLLIKNMEDIQSKYNEVRLDCFLIVMCLDNEIQVNINNQTYQLHPNNALLCLPNTIIKRIDNNKNYRIRILGFSNSFIRNTLKLEKRTWEISMHIYRNPVQSIKVENNYDCFSHYGALIESKINNSSNCYHNEILKHLFSSFLLDILGCIDKEISEEDKSNFTVENIKRADYTYIRFIEMLSKDCGKHRSVSYFANKLCYSTKYFSNIVKQTCGRNPLEIINEKAINHIKYQLKYTDKSIKEISEEFNFPNQSFFGRYVKLHTGLSPINYRNTKEE